MSDSTTPADISGRRDALLRTMMRTEASIGFGIVSAIIAVFLFAHLLFGDVTGVSVTSLPDALQMLVFGVMGFLIHEGRVPLHRLAWVVQGTIVVGVLGQLYDYTLNLEPWAPAMLLVMTGTVVLEWPAFWTANLPLAIVMAITYFSHEPEHGASWVAATAVAVAAAAGTVRSRRAVALSLARAQTQAERLAVEDPLTRLLNRRGLVHEVRFVRGVARRADDPYFAVFIDVGGLKQLNDTHGHEVGDRLLRAVADAVRMVARETDIACRWGGDEFLIVGAGSRPQPEAMARRLLAAMDASALPADWDPVLWVGSAESAAVDEDLHDVIVRADEDLYQRRSQHPGSLR